MEIPAGGIPPLPTMEQLEEAIAECESINWDNVDLGKVDDVIPWPLKAMVLLRYEKQMDGYLYRVRTYHSFHQHPTEEDNIFRKLSFSYPPKGTLSRAGTINHPVFYASSNLDCALVEIKSEDPLNFVGCWKIKHGHKISLRPYISNLPEHIKQLEGRIVQEMLKQLNIVYSNYSPEQQAIFKRIDEFHDRQFTKNGNTDVYKYSSWLANKNFSIPISEIFPKLDAIVYQSTQDDRLGTNFAISPGFVDDHMELKKAYLIAHNFDENNKRFKRSIYSVGNINDDSITWNLPNNEDNEEFVREHHVNFHTVKLN